jgi:hypothetical protein
LLDLYIIAYEPYVFIDIGIGYAVEYKQATLPKSPVKVTGRYTDPLFV